MTPTLLLVEDDTAIVEFLQTALSSNAQYRLEWTGTARAAQDALRRRRSHGESPYAAILLDLGLPDRDGLELVPWLRAESPESVLMIVSARGQEADKIHALQTGADDYLTKPFTLGELQARLQAHLRRSGASLVQGPLLAGDWALSEDSRHLQIGDRAIALTAKEYQLMRLFLRNAGAVLPHKRILTAVWGSVHAEQTHYLRIYVQRLREKIEIDPNHPQHIVTELGVGYRFIV